MEKERIEDIYGEIKGTVNINGQKYFFKRNDAYVELLVEQIVDLFGLRHAHYVPIMVNEMPYYISKDLNYEGSFVTADRAGLSGTDVKEIQDFIFFVFHNDYERLTEQFMKMFFMDLLILNIDRNNDNWGFMVVPGGIDLCVLDNDLSFIHETSVMTAVEGNEKRNGFIEINNILYTFPEHYVNMFIEMFNLLDVNKLKELIKNVEEQIGRELPFKENYIRRFDLQRFKIERVLEEKKQRLMV